MNKIFWDHYQYKNRTALALWKEHCSSGDEIWGVNFYPDITYAYSKTELGYNMPKTWFWA